MKPLCIDREKKIRNFALAAALGAVALIGAQRGQAADTDASRETITPAFRYPIANVPGKSLTAVIVDYPPGAKTPSHRHGKAFVVGYVLQGAIRSKLDNGEEHVFRAGESWSEAPGAHHRMSENASDTEPAKLIAVFVSDSKHEDLVDFDKKQ